MDANKPILEFNYFYKDDWTKAFQTHICTTLKQPNAWAACACMFVRALRTLVRARCFLRIPKHSVARKHEPQLSRKERSFLLSHAVA